MQFTLGANQYATVKMPVLTQLNLVRRLAPVLGSIAAASKVQEGDDDAKKLDFARIGLEAIGSLSESDTNWITLTCLSCVQRKVGDQGYAFVAVSGEIMFDDLELDDIMKIVGKVIQENLGRFFPQGDTTGSEAKPSS